jgi:hypothetical protein
MADKFAKDSLNQTHIFIPEQRASLPPVSIIFGQFPAGEHIYENNPFKLYQKIYFISGKKYRYKGNWHKYLSPVQLNLAGAIPFHFAR